MFSGPRCSLFPEQNLLVFDGIVYDAPLRGLHRDYEYHDMQCIADNARIFNDNVIFASWDSETGRRGVGIPVKLIGSGCPFAV